MPIEREGVIDAHPLYGGEADGIHETERLVAVLGDDRAGTALVFVGHADDIFWALVNKIQHPERAVSPDTCQDQSVGLGDDNVGGVESNPSPRQLARKGDGSSMVLVSFDGQRGERSGVDENMIVAVSTHSSWLSEYASAKYLS